MYRIEISAFGISRDIYSKYKLTKSHVGFVFIGSWCLAVVLLSVFGDPSLRSGHGVFVRLFGLAVLFAIVPTGLMFAIAKATVTRGAGVCGVEGGVPSTADRTSKISLDRLLLIMVVIVALAAALDWFRSARNRGAATESVALQTDICVGAPRFLRFRSVALDCETRS
jgi:hypothetical protein